MLELAECNSDAELSNLKLVRDEVLNTAYPNDMFDENCIESARRVGRRSDNSYRMIIVKFRNVRDKLKLFTGRPIFSTCYLHLGNFQRNGKK